MEVLHDEEINDCETVEEILQTVSKLAILTKVDERELLIKLGLCSTIIQEKGIVQCYEALLKSKFPKKNTKKILRKQYFFSLRKVNTKIPKEQRLLKSLLIEKKDRDITAKERVSNRTSNNITYNRSSVGVVSNNGVINGLTLNSAINEKRYSLVTNEKKAQKQQGEEVYDFVKDVGRRIDDQKVTGRNDLKRKRRRNTSLEEYEDEEELGRKKKPRKIIILTQEMIDLEKKNGPSETLVSRTEEGIDGDEEKKNGPSETLVSRTEEGIDGNEIENSGDRESDEFFKNSDGSCSIQ